MIGEGLWTLTTLDWNGRRDKRGQKPVSPKVLSRAAGNQTEILSHGTFPAFALGLRVDGGGDGLANEGWARMRL